MTRGGAVSIKDDTQKKDGHTTGLLRASLAMTGHKRINPNEQNESKREALPLPARHGKRRRSNPEHNTMPRGGAVSIKDEKQKKDGNTAGLLHLRFAMTRNKRINPNEPYEYEREALPLLHVMASEGEAIQNTTR